MSFATELRLPSDLTRSSGSFDDRDLCLIQKIFSAAWRALCAQGICSEGEAREPEHRDLLARLTLDVFNEGEREIEPAAQRCVESFAALERKR